MKETGKAEKVVRGKMCAVWVANSEEGRGESRSGRLLSMGTKKYGLGQSTIAGEIRKVQGLRPGRRTKKKSKLEASSKQNARKIKKNTGWGGRRPG